MFKCIPIMCKHLPGYKKYTKDKPLLWYNITNRIILIRDIGVQKFGLAKVRGRREE